MQHRCLDSNRVLVARADIYGDGHQTDVENVGPLETMLGGGAASPQQWILTGAARNRALRLGS